MSDKTKAVARCSSFDIGVEDHGWVVLFGHFDFGGECQGLGYGVDADFLRSFLGVFGVERLSEVRGRYCLVTATHASITRIDPMLPKAGKPFDIAAWSEKKRGGAL